MTKIENIITDEERDVIEPYNPEYLLKDGYAIPELSSSEKRWLRKVGTLEAKLKRAHIPFTWDADYECFVLCKYITKPSENSKRKKNVLGTYNILGRNETLEKYGTYPYVMYANITEDGEYAFGGETEDICVSGRVSEVVAEIIEWMSNNKPSCR